MSIRIVRAFVQLREMLAAHRDLAIRMDRLEQEQQNHASVINILADEIDALKLPRICFKMKKAASKEAAKSAIKEVQQSLTN